MNSPRAPLRTLLLWTVTLAVVAVLLVLGLAGGGGRNGRLAPPLPHESLSGTPVTLAALHGHGALVVFWASWCGPCQQEAPALERFARSAQGRARLVGVDVSDPVIADARAFLKRYGWTFPVLRDPEGTVGQAYGVTTGLPTTFLIDSSGHVRATLRGPQTQQALTRALASVE
jgi:cytochrome c biogenesis protein CcmG, thiol:disulfide interchange protein DsbE